MSDPPSTDPTPYLTPDPGPPSEKNTKEPTSEPDYDYLSENSATMREGSMGHLSRKDIMRYQKGSDPPRFSTLEECTKETPWRETWKIRVVGQDKILEAGEDHLPTIESPPQILTNLYKMDKYLIGAKLMREDTAKLWSTKELLGRDEREILVWHQSLNHVSFKSLLSLPKRGIVQRNLRKIRKIPPCVA